MKILRTKNYKRISWKNGGGETAEILTFPSNASLETFDWRLSIARVDESGPFSSFLGIDRTICIISGDGVALNFLGGKEVRLTDLSSPLSFSGDDVVFCSLLRGAIEDLNVMTRHGRFKHSVKRVAVSGTQQLGCTSGCMCVFVVIEGELDVCLSHNAARLLERDALLFDGYASEVVDVAPRGNVDVLAIKIDADSDLNAIPCAGISRPSMVR